MSSSSKNRAAASTAAMPSKFGVPVSNLRGPTFSAGRTLAIGREFSKSGSTHSTPACGPYHLYGEVANTSQPSCAISIGRCTAKCTASTKTRAPTSCAASMIGLRSGAVPSKLEAPVIATHLVLGVIILSIASVSSMNVVVLNGASTCSAPESSHAMRHGETLASWSSLVPTTLSPGLRVRATARVNAIVIVVMLAPKQMPSGSAPNNVPTTWRVRSSRASQSLAEEKYPPVLAFEPPAAKSLIARIAASTICVPAGPSKRAQLLLAPGKRVRISTGVVMARTVLQVG
ncbi:unannotated protein [freshwater metagenome]|uniref:Unannotated protein n=1 Tax=freshwater metagenome TaxID=449393 RepID=A0A6J6WXV6_9ZZZZ